MTATVRFVAGPRGYGAKATAITTIAHTGGIAVDKDRIVWWVSVAVFGICLLWVLYALGRASGRAAVHRERDAADIRRRLTVLELSHQRPQPPSQSSPSPTESPEKHTTSSGV